VVIGGAGSKSRGVRDLITDLALLPVEGGARVAIVDGASRMNEDAQAALLKTLEEPPDGVTIVLCADAEEPLLPTIRSRCARIRLGPVATREIEAILADAASVEPALAARLARIAGGRPGAALAWSADPDALRARDELVRSLLDLVDQRAAFRLAAVRAALLLASSMDPGTSDETDGATGARSARGRPARASSTPSERPADPEVEVEDGSPATVQRAPASERRRTAERLVEVWTDVVRDIAVCQLGMPGAAREIGLLDETTAIAARLDGPAIAAFLDRLGRAAVLLASNVSPELVVDDLALAMPGPTRAAA
jgi:DNA polymerase-3 subunit delta'